MSLPIIILGGGDPAPGYLPPDGREEHPLTGCKGADLQIGDRKLIEVVLERFAEIDLFGPAYVAGPRRVYGALGLDAELIDTDGGFGDNIRAGIEAARKKHPGSHLAMTTCDVLPDLDELRALLESFRQSRPADLWFPLIRAPERPEALGVSAWKPRYRVPTAGGETVPVLPSHIAIFDPEAMRLSFLYRLLQDAYRSRNRPVRYRRWFLIRRLILGILYHDLLHLASLRLPTVTLDTVQGFFAARRLAEGKLAHRELEDRLRRIFVKRRHRRAFPDRRTLLPILEGLSLARDIDTVEEARDAGATALEPGTAPTHG